MDVKILDDSHKEMKAGSVMGPLTRLHGWLGDQRRFLTAAQWHELREAVSAHPLASLLRQDPLIGRAFRKPRGYAGDAEMMDMIYGMGTVPSPGEGVLAELHSFAVGIAAFRSVRYRREAFRTRLDESAARTPGLTVASVGAGHLREVEDSRALRDGELGGYAAFDQDPESLAEIDRAYGRYGVRTFSRRVREVITDGVLPERVDLIHAGGLYDYLTDRTAVPLTRSLVASLRPAGTLMIANIVPTCRDIAYLEAVMDWPLVHRDEKDMRALLEEVPDGRVADLALHRDPDDVMTFMTVTVR
ncbi:hypothetical protein [Streptomyces sp. G-G2]|uniref:hypothetical protein n=1 Tax=Streptomyces sp. G-G2 TaxID=3046201 RepID=UPI0024B9D206|nr:hypothetical protein [Streptomyces sp. G-G2]MDJ0385948.1 hypothetical protein [Streptomyces sp. G-G2]